MANKRYRAKVLYNGQAYWVSAPTKKDLEVKKALKLKELEDGIQPLNNRITVKEFAERCVEVYKEPSQSYITYKTYVGRMDCCIIRHIGHMKLADVKPIHCQQVLNKQKGNSTYQISQVNQMLRFIFGKAVTEGFIRKNPAADLVKPKGTKTTRRALTEREAQAFYEIMDTDPRFILYKFMLFCGCRTGEAAAIEGRDIQSFEGQNVLHIRGTKTKASDRYVPIPDFFIVPDVGPFEKLCKNAHGTKHTHESLSKCWIALKKAWNIALGCKVKGASLVPPYPLSDDLVPYCFRHTFCTNLQKAGVDIRKAQYLMGHSDIQMTANVYTHVDINDVIGIQTLVPGNHKIAKKVAKKV